MKNLSLILNIVLLVAVAVLFYLHFAPAGTETSSTTVAAGDLKVAYINSDTVLKYYEYLKTQKTQLEAKTEKMGQEYRNRVVGLQNEIAAYQRNVSSMTLGQVKATEEDLGKKQQNLQLYERSLNQQLLEEEGKLQKELYDRITTYLKKYGSDKGLQVVLKRDPSSDVLWATDILDVSQDVIKGLNDEYALEKSGGVKADSTAVKK